MKSNSGHSTRNRNNRNNRDKNSRRGVANRRDNPRKRGAALMMTLVMLVLLSILITGFVVSMRTELTTSYSAENIQRTKMVAQAAVSHGIELLRANIPDPAGIRETPGPHKGSGSVGGPPTDPDLAPPRNWISNPGRLVVDITGQNGRSEGTVVDLHTGTQHDGTDITSFDLNAPLAGEAAAAIIEPANDNDPRPKMRVAWVNILKDPSEPASETNAVIGRYAFWMDDESTKINFNTAIGKDANAWRWLEDEWLVPYTVMPRGFDTTTVGTASTFNQSYALGHPRGINLDLLFKDYGNNDPKDFDRNGLSAHVFHNGFHQYPEAIMKYYDFDADPDVISPAEKEWFDENKWNITFYNRSPEFNVFGKSRFFTTYEPLALEGGPAYQMPFAHDGVLHLHHLLGMFGRGEDDAVGNRANLEVLRHYLHRSDWPGWEGRSFAQKFGRGSLIKNAAFQVALNIIEMGNLATQPISQGGNIHINAYSTGVYLTTAHRYDRNGNVVAWPELDYWRAADDKDGSNDTYGLNEDKLFMAALPGPHLTEVQFTFQARPAKDNPTTTDPEGGYNIAWWYDVEYYMHPHGWVVPTTRGYNFTPEVDGNGVPMEGTWQLNDVNQADQPFSAEASPFPTVIDFARVYVRPEHLGAAGIYEHFNGLVCYNWQDKYHVQAIADIADVKPNKDPSEPYDVSGEIITIMPEYPERLIKPGYLGNKPHIRTGRSQTLLLRTEGDRPTFVSPRSGRFPWPAGSPSRYPTDKMEIWLNGFVPEKDAYKGDMETRGTGREFDRTLPAIFNVKRGNWMDSDGNPQRNVKLGHVLDIAFDVRLGLAAPNSYLAASHSSLEDLNLEEAAEKLDAQSFRPKQMFPLGETPKDDLPGTPRQVMARSTGGWRFAVLNNRSADGTRDPEDLSPPADGEEPDPEAPLGAVYSDDYLTHEFRFNDITSPPNTDGDNVAYFGWKCVTDPRIARKMEHPAQGNDLWEFYQGRGNDDLGEVDFGDREKPSTTRDGSGMSKFRHLQFSTNQRVGGLDPRIKKNVLPQNQWLHRGNRAYQETFRFISPGYFSLISTGQASGVPFRTLSLLPKEEEDRTYRDGVGSSKSPPDYVLFDLFAPSFPMDADQWNDDFRLPDSWSAISYMNSTAGQVNLNCRIYPDDDPENFNPPARTKPLEAVFHNLRQDPEFAADFAQAIDDYQDKNEWFDYNGELAEVDGYMGDGDSDYTVGNSQFRQEELLRNMIGCLTTKSNTFGLWGVAQTVRKSARNLEIDPSIFQVGDTVEGQKRFYALIERYIWPGRDGAPGNALVNADGKWDKLAEPTYGDESSMALGDFRGILRDTPGSPPAFEREGWYNNNNQKKFFAAYDGPDEVDMISPYDFSNTGAAGTATNFQRLDQAMADVKYEVDGDTDNLEEAYNPPHPVIKYRVVYFKYLDQ